MNIWWKIGLILALAVAASWGLHLYKAAQQKIGYDKAVAEYNVKLLAEEAKARAKETDWKAQLKGAQDEAQKLRKDKDVAVGKLTASNNSLRQQLTNISNGLSDITITACRARVSTLTIVFGQCTDRLADMANHAQGQYVDSVTCREAWPK